MGCLGVHFSLSSEEVQQLLAIDDQDERAEHIHDVIEEEYFEEHPERMVETDKAWDAIHRVLSDGTLDWDGGEYPLNHVILAGQLLCEDDFIAVLKTPPQVADVASALPSVSEAEFRARYRQLPPDYGVPLSDEDFEYTWENFQDVCVFWHKAAAEKRYVLFTADQ